MKSVSIYCNTEDDCYVTYDDDIFRGIEFDALKETKFSTLHDCSGCG